MKTLFREEQGIKVTWNFKVIKQSNGHQITIEIWKSWSKLNFKPVFDAYMHSREINRKE
jgi:hypothetical protein